MPELLTDKINRMTEEQNKLFDFLESLPSRGLIVFNEEFPSDDYFTSLGRLRKSFKAKNQGQTLHLDSVSMSSFCRLPRINCFSGICETCGKTH